MKQSLLIHCSCEHEIWCEVRYEEGLGCLVFFDNVETSETYNEQVTRCPGCERQITEFLLEASNEVSKAEARRAS